MDPSTEQYVSLTTFKRDGTPVAAPVWCIPLDGGFGFWTSSGSGKWKRLAHTSRVLVQPCDGRGKVKAGTTPEEATARRVEPGPELDDIHRRIVDKYGVFTKITKFLNGVGNVIRRRDRPYGDRGVVVTLAAATPAPDTTEGAAG
jgi:uncharacterized protein